MLRDIVRSTMLQNNYGRMPFKNRTAYSKFSNLVSTETQKSPNLTPY